MTNTSNKFLASIVILISCFMLSGFFFGKKDTPLPDMPKGSSEVEQTIVVRFDSQPEQFLKDTSDNVKFMGIKADEFDAEFLKKIETFLDTHYDVNQIAEQTVMDEPKLAPENYLVTFDFSENQWRDISEFDVIKNPNGMWVAPDAYPEVMNLISGYPLMDASIYHDAMTEQSYLFCTADFLPNLPPNYMWLSLKTYMEPSEVGGYKNGGSLWVVQGLGSNNNLTLEDVLEVPKDLVGKYLNPAIKDMPPQHNEILAFDLDIPLIEKCNLNYEPTLFPEQVMEFH